MPSPDRDKKPSMPQVDNLRTLLRIERRTLQDINEILRKLRKNGNS